MMPPHLSSLRATRRMGALLLGLAMFCAATRAQETPPSNPRLAGKAGYQIQEFSYTSAKGETRQRKLYLWYPTTDEPREYQYPWQRGVVAPEGKVAEGRHPLILFSHGYFGSADQSLFITESLARAGYIVAATNHADSLSGGHPFQQKLPKYAAPGAWSDENFLDRKEDMEAMLNHVLKLDGKADSILAGRIQKDAIGATGHSLGGYTILGLAGGWPSWREERIRAIVAFSPYSAPFNLHMTAGAIRIPVMLQGGTLDFAITPTLPLTYAKLEPPKYFLVLKKASHFEWTNFVTLRTTTVDAVEQAGNPQLIVDYTVAFFDHWLLHRDAPLLKEKNEELESYRFQERKE